jgi:hypothetical protein
MWTYESAQLFCMCCPTLMLIDLSCNYVNGKGEKNGVSVHLHILSVFLAPLIWTSSTLQLQQMK